MAANTKIEWTDATWNPVVGCQKCSEGCRNCYAKKLHDQRHVAYHAGKRVPLQYAEPFETVQLMPDRLRDPLKWRKPKKVFVNSVSDLFHKDVPFEFIDRVLATIFTASRHTFQALTKRADRMAEYFADEKRVRAAVAAWCKGNLLRNASDLAPWLNVWPIPNLWLGVSVENQQAADERIPHLLRVPAAVRFLSCEPLLGPVDLRQIVLRRDSERGNELSNRLGDWVSPLTGAFTDSPRINWVIVGGESGPGARPMHPDWARSMRDQCQEAGVPFFFKQWGEWRESAVGQHFDTSMGRAQRVPTFIVSKTGTVHCFENDQTQEGAQVMLQIGKRAAGRLLDGREHNEFPTVEAAR